MEKRVLVILKLKHEVTNLLRISKTFLFSIGTPSFLESNHPLRNERFKKKISFKDVYTYIWIKEQLVPPLNLPSFPGTISRGSCKKPVIYSPPGRRGGGVGGLAMECGGGRERRDDLIHKKRRHHFGSTCWRLAHPGVHAQSLRRSGRTTWTNGLLPRYSYN